MTLNSFWLAEVENPLTLIFVKSVIIMVPNSWAMALSFDELPSNIAKTVFQSMAAALLGIPAIVSERNKELKSRSLTYTQTILMCHM